MDQLAKARLWWVSGVFDGRKFIPDSRVQQQAYGPAERQADDVSRCSLVAQLDGLTNSLTRCRNASTGNGFDR
jgi:hypothetical protein